MPLLPSPWMLLGGAIVWLLVAVYLMRHPEDEPPPRTRLTANTARDHALGGHARVWADGCAACDAERKP